MKYRTLAVLAFAGMLAVSGTALARPVGPDTPTPDRPFDEMQRVRRMHEQQEQEQNRNQWPVLRPGTRPDRPQYERPYRRPDDEHIDRRPPKDHEDIKHNRKPPERSKEGVRPDRRPPEPPKNHSRDNRPHPLTRDGHKRRVPPEYRD